MSILIKLSKIFQENIVDFTFKEKIYCRLFSFNFFVTIFGQIFHKIQTLSSKTARNKFLWSTLIKFAGNAHRNTTNTIVLDWKGG